LIALSLPRTPLAFAVLAALLALAHEALHPANATATAEICPPALRPRGFALARLATNLGVSVGPVVGGFLALWDYRSLFWVDGLTSLAAAGLALRLLPSAGPHKERQPRRARPAWRDPGFAAMLPLVLGVGLIFVQIINALPLYMRSAYGLPENAIGGLLAVNTLLIVTVEMLIMHGLRSARPQRVASVGALLLGCGLALIPLGRGGLYAVFTVIVWTMGEILTLPMLMTLVSLRADEAAQGEYQGLCSLAFATSWVIGPSLGMGVYGRLGAETLWFGCGLLGVTLGLGFARLGPAQAERRHATEIQSPV
jgi:predicted MFS family arabinose efflux permease